MSGGEQQRVTIARALVAKPAIVWADEPTGALDTHMATQVMDLLCRLNREEQQTIVLVSHDPGVGERADPLVRMRDGRLESDRREALTGVDGRRLRPVDERPEAARAD